ncbi:SET domain-containing protein [Ceratocystis lukuohia]|uniref:SET domain-containing protein n=1 Tax=Ceratocystis lukuohia TaxID=2019550 RepID=A0ABR4MJ44_9PEZI
MGNSLDISLETPISVLRHLERLIRLIKEQNPEIFSPPQLYSKAADTAIVNSDFARGYVFRKRAATIWERIAGQDSPKFLEAQAMLLNPYIFESCGMSRQWMTSFSDIPTGLGPDAFEKWLWRRGNTAAIQSCFSSFLDLPHECIPEPDFYEGTRNNNFRPLRHWCFLGNITDFSTIVRLHFQLEDLDGSIIPLFFHTPGRGQEVENHHTKIGSTIAILYPVHHVFMDGRTGIRLENPQMFKARSL